MNATDLAHAIVGRLLEAGVEHVVVCPGSRNAPLLLALDAAARAGVITLHSRIDERTAGFLALGIAKSSRRPTVVCTTSGTAVANLHPAVLEAAHAGVPLIALTADRPARLRGTGANQTTDQVGIFASAVPTCDIDSEADVPPLALGEATITLDGPTHWNVQFDEPLLPPSPTEASQTSTPIVEASQTSTPIVEFTGRFSRLDGVELELGPRTVVVAGDDAGSAARILAEHANWPLLAEPSSGARNGANVIRTYRLLLATPLADEIERVVVYGHPTLSRPVMQLCSRADVEVISVRARGKWPQRPFAVAAEYDELAVEPDVPAWLDEWRTADRDLSTRLDAFVAGLAGLTPYDVAAAVHAAVPPGGMLLVGASNPIRDLDLMAGAYQPRQRRLVIANRGLAGIDGTLSTAIGAALGRPDRRAIAYLGDVTFLHDLTGLVLGPAEARPDLTIVVANDDGGSIFATLEQGAPAYAAAFEKVFATPHGLDLGTLCDALRIRRRRVNDRTGLDAVLAEPASGIEVIEAVVRRDDRRALDTAIRALATTPTV